MSNNAQTIQRAIPSPREERVGRGPGRGATQQDKRSASSPRPSPPSDGGEGARVRVQGDTNALQNVSAKSNARPIPSPREARAGRGLGRGAAPKSLARLLRRNQTDEERELWLALKAGRFAGFKFRRQHLVEKYYLDFYCPTAKLSVELDGFRHGLPEQIQNDAARTRFLDSQGIEELRFWNHQWNKNREGVLLEIWEALYCRTGCVAVMRKVQNHRFVPPNPDLIISKKGSAK
jgi:very-short-patch-repair endonuclease